VFPPFRKLGHHFDLVGPVVVVVVVVVVIGTEVCGSTAPVPCPPSSSTADAPDSVQKDERRKRMVTSANATENWRALAVRCMLFASSPPSGVSNCGKS
jgi:hypothetical protein